MPPETRPVALVTGSSSGIGAEIARRLGADGYAVVVNSRSSIEAGQAVAEAVGGTYLQADVADDAQARGLVDAVLAQHGRLDVLVNNAGVTEVIAHHDLAAATPEIWRRLYDINVVAPFVLVTAAEQALRAAAPGCVVNVSSLAGVRPTGSSIPYSSSKAAFNHQTRLLAKALGPDIRVNAVAPGLIETPWTADWTDLHALVGARAPMRRTGAPADVAEVVMGLVRSGYVTGQVVVVDGGLGLMT
ncbi:MAG: short-chain dehydrogenase/reductase [Frankiales bacterium]|jgi:NAD(P)-dependent dehydrogenase (short-subunit alcohol dehydrogenase family)|nr:short-chain dehydrogenase/reductase [Frankiales bacterium]